MVATTRVSIEDFAVVSRDGIWELIDGEPIEVTPSADRSGWIAGEVFGRLRDHVRSNNLGWAFPPETGFILFDDRATVRSPDAAFVRLDRLPAFSDRFVPMAPDFAAEVLSPSDRMADALAKVATYLQAGTLLVWLVNPATRTIVVFRAESDPVTLGEADTLDGGDVLPGFTVPVAEIFA